MSIPELTAKKRIIWQKALQESRVMDIYDNLYNHLIDRYKRGYRNNNLFDSENFELLAEIAKRERIAYSLVTHRDIKNYGELEDSEKETIDSQLEKELFEKNPNAAVMLYYVKAIADSSYRKGGPAYAPLKEYIHDNELEVNRENYSVTSKDLDGFIGRIQNKSQLISLEEFFNKAEQQQRDDQRKAASTQNKVVLAATGALITSSLLSVSGAQNEKEAESAEKSNQPEVAKRKRNWASFKSVASVVLGAVAMVGIYDGLANGGQWVSGIINSRNDKQNNISRG